MKTSKHTPGPWVIGDDHPSVCRISSQGSDQIGAMDIAPFGLAEAMANARLLAAAPELLEALRSCRDRLAQLPGSAVPTTPTYELIACVDAAIARAEGGAQ